MADAASTTGSSSKSEEGAAAPNPIQQAMFDYQADFSDFHNAARARVGLQPHVNTQPAGVFRESKPANNPNPFSYKNPFAK
jgi:hypothetical protein